jgi:hypothetical protein
MVVEPLDPQDGTPGLSPPSRSLGHSVAAPRSAFARSALPRKRVRSVAQTGRLQHKMALRRAATSLAENRTCRLVAVVMLRCTRFAEGRMSQSRRQAISAFSWSDANAM